MGERIKVLITVKTYPLPSRSYEELVCTAGVLEDGKYIRLYPINYRYRPPKEQFKKYQWISLEVEKNSRDPRPESYRPVGEISIISDQLPTRNNWAERRECVLKGPKHSMCELKDRPQKEISLAIIKPSIIEEFIIEEAGRDWKRQWEAYMKQPKLFGPDRKPLEKIPYKFIYVFKCDEPGCKGHRMMIEDWEISQLYRNVRDRYKDEKVACEKVRDKFFHKICGEDKDTHFFVGTVLEFGSWIIIGTFWPNKESANRAPKSIIQPELPF